MNALVIIESPVIKKNSRLKYLFTVKYYNNLCSLPLPKLFYTLIFKFLFIIHLIFIKEISY